MSHTRAGWWVALLASPVVRPITLPSCGPWAKITVSCVLAICHAIATPEPRYCPVLTNLTIDTGKFGYIVLCHVALLHVLATLPPCCPTLYHAVLRCSQATALHQFVGYIILVTCDTRLILAHSRYLHNIPRRWCTLRTTQRFIFVQQRISNEAHCISLFHSGATW